MGSVPIFPATSWRYQVDARRHIPFGAQDTILLPQLHHLDAAAPLRRPIEFLATGRAAGVGEVEQEGAPAADDDVGMAADDAIIKALPRRPQQGAGLPLPGQRVG